VSGSSEIESRIHCELLNNAGAAAAIANRLCGRTPIGYGMTLGARCSM